MKKAILIICLIAIISADTDPCSAFDSMVSSTCEELSSSTECIYSGNQCISNYDNCEEYSPESGFDDAKCLGIIPIDPLNICEVKTEGGAKTCHERLRQCSEHTSNDNCLDLQAGEGQRCLLIENKKCEAHYTDCSSLTSKGKTQCEANIPNDGSKICSWSSNACTTADRYCEKYLQYQGPITETSENCINLKAEESKVCIFEEGKTCRQVYDGCDKGNNDESLCNAIKPLNLDKTDYDHFNKCVYNSPNCEAQLKNCEDYEKGFDDYIICSFLSKLIITNKMCSYDDSKDECKEIYITCDSYNQVVTNPDDRDKTICQAIVPRNISTEIENRYSICDLNDAKECISQKKPCNKFTEEYYCLNQILDDTSKKCGFINNQCKEVYKTCSDYTNNVDAPERNKNDCEEIEYFNTDDNYRYKCLFDNSDNQNKCEPVKMKCEDYKEQREYGCHSLSSNLDSSEASKFICKTIDGKCSKQYLTCESYEEKNKTICESIKLNSKTAKCVLKHDQYCTIEGKTCVEYLGKNEFECSSYQASSPDKVCGIVNGKCTEKSIINYCSDYRGNNKEECESIQPHYDFGTPSRSNVDPSAKCVYTTEGCIKQNKKCTEATTELECPNIIPSDTDKQCIFINNKCVEQYKTCQLYHNKEETTNFNKEGCESILNSELSYPSSKYKCKYTAPTLGESRGSCTLEPRTCSEFKPELIKSQCTGISITDFSKKCVFNANNNSCSSKAKTCLELSNVAGTQTNLDVVCNNAETSSSNKICKIKENESGCEEIDKSTPTTEVIPETTSKATTDQVKPTEKEEQIATTEVSTPPPENNNNNNSSGNNYLSNIIFIAICLLF